MKEMSFISYFKATYFFGALPQARNFKSTLLCFVPWLLFLVPVAACSFDNIVLTTAISGSSVLFTAIITVSRSTIVPSQYRLYPISHAKKALYVYFGDMLASMLTTVALFAICLAYGLLVSGLTVAFAEGDTTLFTNYFNMYLSMPSAAGGVFLALYFFMGLGWEQLSNMITGKIARIVSHCVFFTLHAAAIIVAFAFSVTNSPEGVMSLLNTLPNLPYYIVFLCLYGLAALALNVAAFVLFIRSARK